MDKHFKHWAVEQHEKTNHLYDDKLPYSFHLQLVVDVATQFKSIWNEVFEPAGISKGAPVSYMVMYNSCWGHDLLEDTRVSYNDIIKELKKKGYDNWESKHITEIIFALTNNKGRNRTERANEAYYEGIRNTPGAVFVKLCDRIANVKYSEMVKSSMYKKYKDEYEHFVVSLGLGDLNEADGLTFTEEGLKYEAMITYLEELLDIAD